MDSEDNPSPPPSIQLQSTTYMQSSNLVAAVSKGNKITGPNYVPATSCASTAWWSGPTVNGPLDQRFQGDFPISSELLLAIQNPGQQHHVNDSTAFRSIPGNSMLSQSQTVDDRAFYYPQELWYPWPEDDNLAHTYTWSQCRQPVWYNPGQFPPSLQVMTSQPSTQLLPNMMPPQEQSVNECAWIEDGKQCGHPILNDRHKLGIHLSDFHGVQGNDKKDVMCLWQGCNQNMQRGAIRRHIISCHLKTRWTSENCSKTYSRRDTMKKHAKECQVA